MLFESLCGKPFGVYASLIFIQILRVFAYNIECIPKILSMIASVENVSYVKFFFIIIYNCQKSTFVFGLIPSIIQLRTNPKMIV